MSGIDISNISSVTSVKKAGSAGISGLLQKDIALFEKRFGDVKKERYYSGLGILLSAGVDIRTGLDLAMEGQKANKDRDLFLGIRESVVNGNSLSEAMKKTGKFSAYELYSLKIGEESGRLPEIMTELSAYFARSVKQRRQIINALSYPCMVLVTAIGTIIFMMSFIVPMFADVFKRFGGDLPGITQFVLNVSDFVSATYGWFLGALGAGILLIYVCRKTEWWRKGYTSAILKLPVIGPIMLKIYLARFCVSMKLLLSSGTPLVSALELVRNMITFYPMERALERIKEQVTRGKSFYESMSGYSFFPKPFISLVKVGEEVNRLDQIFSRLSTQFSEEVDHKTETLRSLIEPLLIVFIGAFVAVILIAMYLPLFKLGTTVF